MNPSKSKSKRTIFRLYPDVHKQMKSISVNRGIAYQYLLESFVDHLIDYDRVMSRIVNRAKALSGEGRDV